MRPILQASDMPVVLAATQPVEPLLRSLSAIDFLPESIETSPDRMTDAELAAAARPILDQHYQRPVLSPSHISDPTSPPRIPYAVSCL